MKFLKTHFLVSYVSSEAAHILWLFLLFWQIEPWCSYYVCFYKKECILVHSRTPLSSFSRLFHPHRSWPSNFPWRLSVIQLSLGCQELGMVRVPWGLSYFLGGGLFEGGRLIRRWGLIRGFTAPFWLSSPSNSFPWYCSHMISYDITRNASFDRSFSSWSETRTCTLKGKARLNAI